ncbi:hypothetical protein R3P38DRAFT_3290685 [Favolaschia claudopus]|uniref:Uncharacterized protein n=1 Tax=Favolaschia claudopus TaxID=2862362 RepID=A0AAV9ZSA2_9AGAR
MKPSPLPISTRFFSLLAEAEGLCDGAQEEILQQLEAAEAREETLNTKAGTISQPVSTSTTFNPAVPSPLAHPPRSGTLPPRDPSRWAVPCPGIPIEWNADSFYTSYPFQLHAPNAKNCAPYDLTITSGIPKARSPHCTGGIVTLEGILPCAKCSQLTLDVKIIRDRATRPFERVHKHDDLNADQLRAKVEVVEDKVNTLKLKQGVFNLKIFYTTSEK